MGQNQGTSLGARGRQDAFMFFPHDLTIVTSNEPHPSAVTLEAAGMLTLLKDRSHFLYDRRADGPVDEELAESIRQQGQVLQPIRIMRDGDRKIVVVGRQRVKSAAFINAGLKKLLGKDAEASFMRVPAMLWRADEAKSFRAMIEENEQRTEDTPIIRAEKMQRALDLGYSEEDVARLFRLGVAQLKNMLRLLDCSPEVRAAVAEGELPTSIAYTDLAKLPREKQNEALGEMRSAGTLRGTDAKEAVAAVAKGQKPVKREPGEKRKTRPSALKIESMIDQLREAAKTDKLIAGVIIGLQKSLGMNPRGWSAVKEYLEP